MQTWGEWTAPALVYGQLYYANFIRNLDARNDDFFSGIYSEPRSISSFSTLSELNTDRPFLPTRDTEQDLGGLRMNKDSEIWSTEHFRSEVGSFHTDASAFVINKSH